MSSKTKVLSALVLLFFLCFQHPCAAVSNDIDSLVVHLKKANDTSKVAVLNKIASLYFGKSADNSINYATQAYLLAEKNHLETGMANALVHIARGNYSKGNYDEAVKKFTDAQRIYMRINNKEGLANVYMGLASIYNELARYQEALDYDLKALRIREEANDSLAMASSYINIGLLNAQLKKYDLAMAYYKKSLDIRVALKEEAGIAACYNNIANVHSDRGDYTIALMFLNKSLAIKEKLGNQKAIASTLNNIGAIYYDWDQLKKAEEYFTRAYEIRKNLGDKRGIASSLSNIGSCNIAAGEYKKAIEYLLKSSDISKELGAGDLLVGNYEGLAEAYGALGDHKKAANYYYQVIQLNDSILSVENAKSMNEMQSKFDFEKQEKEIKILTQKNEIQDLEVSRQRLFKNGFIIGFILLLVIAFVLYNRYQFKHRANAKLEAQKQEIERQHDELNVAYGQIEAKNKDITDSIKYAKRIQLAFLPTVGFEKELKDSGFILYKPKDIVSGDFYWMEKKGNQLLIAAVDCTGHGVPGAFMSIVGFNLLNQAVNEHEITKPSDILDEMNAGVTDTLRQYEDESTVKDGMDLALCNINYDTLELQYGGAYNSLWIIREGELIELPANKFPIGTFVGETVRKFDNTSFQLKKKDCIYLFTDGYADQFGGPLGKKFKYKQLQQLLKDNYSKPAPEQKLILAKAFENWIGKLEQVDDVLIIGIQV